MHRAADEALDHLSVTEKTAVFAMDLPRWVRGHTTCGSVLLTSESNLCCAPLAAETVSWGGAGWKTMNSWTDFLCLCCLMLWGKFANFHTQSELDGFVDIPHFSFFLVTAHGVYRYVRQAWYWKVASWNPWTTWENVGGECKWVTLIEVPLSNTLKPQLLRIAWMWLYWSAPNGQLPSVLSRWVLVAKWKMHGLTSLG